MKLSRGKLKNAIVAAAIKLDDEVRQRRYNNQARAALHTIEGQLGPTDPRSIKLSDQYAGDVLGSRKYAPWLHVYCAISGTFKEGWIPDNYYGMVVSPKKSGEVAKLGNLKTFTNKVLNTEAMPDLAYVIDGIYYSRDYAPVRESDVLNILFDANDRVFFKADNSFQGNSVSIMTKRDLQQQNAILLPDGVFQAEIRQHEFFVQMSANSTATIRITTNKELDGSITIRAGYLRVGRAQDDIVKSSSSVRVSLNKGTGELADVGYLPDWWRIEAHPDTGFSFAGTTIPHFDAATRLCKSLHEGCPHIGCIGWDVCIDRDNKVKLMEWNARYNGINFSEATSGPCFRGLGWENLWNNYPIAERSSRRSPSHESLAGDQPAPTLVPFAHEGTSP